MATNRYDKQYYERLALSPPTITPLPSGQRAVKRWLIAKRRDNHEMEKLRNLVIERSYHTVLKVAKQIIGKPSLPVFERDYTRDNSESATAMHAYLDSNFYFTLDCDWLYQYRVEYAFNECKHKRQLLNLIDSYPFDANATEKVLKPDFHSFYCNVLKAQDCKHITIY